MVTLRAGIASRSIALVLPLVLGTSFVARVARADEPALAPGPALDKPPPPAPPPVETKPDKVAPTYDEPDMTTYASPPTADSLPPPKATGAGGGPQIEPGTGEKTEYRDPALEGPRLALGAGGHVTFGAGPAVSLGASVVAELGNTRWSMGLEGRYDAPASGRTPQGADARASLLGGSFVPCIRAQGTWACAVVLVSRVEASASDATTPTVRDSFLFLGIGGRLQMHFGLPLGFALRLRGELLAHPIPYELNGNDHRLFKSFVVSTTLGPSLVRAF